MGTKLQKSYIEVLGICCSSEVPLIDKILKPLEGVNEVSVVIPTKTVIVLHDSLIISQEQLVKVLNHASLEANVKLHGEVKFQQKWPDASVMACGLLLALSFLKYVYPPMRWLAVGAVFVGFPPIVFKSIAAIRNLTLNVNILVLIAVGGTLALQDYWEAGSIVFLFTISQWLESRATYKAMAVMSSLTNMAPQKATIAESGEQVDVSTVQLNTILAVKAGDAIPIDGVVFEGECEVDEKMLTGESFPVHKQLESTVWAGTINVNGYISMKTTALAKDCVVARMARLVEDAQKKKSRAEKLIDKTAKYYIPAVVLISAGIAVIPAMLRVHNVKYWFYLALVVLVSACPCALILSTPVAMFCALSRAATTGLLIKGGEYLELLAKVRTIAFDKTGTITRGEFMVKHFQSLSDDVSVKTLLYWVSSTESKSSHPMAAALVDYAYQHFVVPRPENVEDFKNFPGEGIFGRIDDREIYIGNRKIALRAGCESVANLDIHNFEGMTKGFIFCGPTPVGVFSLSDYCRSGASEAVEELKALGIRTVMLTGDSHTAATLIQNQLGDALTEVHAELLPEEKARFIEGFKDESPVAMIGDGINDAPALATADVGISMGISGSALAMETGHMILMSNDIQKIPAAVRLARKTRRKLIENVIFSITTKGAILALAFAGHPVVWAAVLTDVGTCLLVILNSMLLFQETPKQERKSCISSTSRWPENTNDTRTPLISHSDKGRCNSQTCSVRCEADSSSSSASARNKCKDSFERQRASEGDDRVQIQASRCGRGCCNNKADKKSSQIVQNYLPPSSGTCDQKTNKNAQYSSCCTRNNSKNEESQRTVETCSSCCKPRKKDAGPEGVLSEIIIE